MLMTLVLPGSAQLVAGNRKVGRIAIGIWIRLWAVAMVLAIVLFFWHGLLFKLMAATWLLALVRFGLIVAAVAWAALFFDAWRLGQPLTLVRTRRIAVAGLNGVLTFAVAGTLLFGAHVIGVQRDFINANFGDGPVSKPKEGRYNVLLMGGDSGSSRWGLRPDSLTVASIDEETGRTILIGLPRNMANFEFAEGSVMDQEFPQGFDCEGCYLNGVYTWALDHKKAFDFSKTRGIDATISAVEGITGLHINYWGMINLAGFRTLVDSVGGVTLNVRDRIPVGGIGYPVTRYIEPGVKKLNGTDTLWFARSRTGSDDYSRMARQKCVMHALATQISPKTIATNFEEIAAASSALMDTNLPAKELGRFMELALKAKDQKISTLSLVPPMINTGDPDIDFIHRRVQSAVDRAEGKADKPSVETPKVKKKYEQKKSSTPSASASPTPTVVTGGSIGSRKDGYAANESDDLSAAC